MIIVEGSISRPTHSPAIAAMFEARKQVFVDLLKWDVPVLNGRFEIDQYDDEHALYVVVAGEGDEHLGSARLLETTRAHILGDLYPQLCAGPVPRAPRTLEITRFCLARGLRAAERRAVRNRLVSALVDVALERGTAQYTGVAELSWLQQILAFGWDCRPLGQPRTFPCGLLGALSITINEKTPALLADNGIWVANVPALARAA